MQYYEINEQTARRANDVNSMSDYRPGSATEEYRAAVDKAAALVQARKAKISPYYHDKLDALLDRYARRLADYYNAYYRNESACPLHPRLRRQQLPGTQKAKAERPPRISLAGVQGD